MTTSHQLGCRRGVAGLVVLMAFSGLFGCGEESRHDSLKERVETMALSMVLSGRVPGLVVGWSSGDETGFVGVGRFSAADGRTPNENTLYEIGSISKVFTAVLLAESVRRGHVTLEDPVERWLPEDVGMPAGETRPITFLDLTTHFSGLPRLPDNMTWADMEDPYADYDIELLQAFLKDHELGREPGESYEYSNLAVGLLGHVLSRVAKETEGGPEEYEALAREWIWNPMGMSSTTVILNPLIKGRFAPGHDGDGNAAKPWALASLVGAGGIRSSAKDLLAFGRGFLGDLPSKASALRPSFAATLVPRREVSEEVWMGLGWHISRDLTVWQHGGQTGGYHAFLGVEPESDSVVVILTNASTGVVDGIGWRLLDFFAGRPVGPLDLPMTVEIAPEDLDRLVGEYAFFPGFGLRVKREGDFLTAQLTGQPAVRIFPEALLKFHYRVVDAAITFELDGEGRGVGLILHQNGKDMEADRIEPVSTSQEVEASGS